MTSAVPIGFFSPSNKSTREILSVEPTRIKVRPRADAPLRHRPEVVDLHLDGRDWATTAQMPIGRDPGCGVGHRRRHPAVQDARSVHHIGADHDFDRDAVLVHGGQPHADQLVERHPGKELADLFRG